MVDTNIRIDGVEARAIPGFSAYFALRDGRVWSTVSGRFLSPAIKKKGYRIVRLKSDATGRTITKSLHRLIALSFIGKPTGPELRHLDGNKSNNAADNLAWGTAVENTLDSVRHGVIPKGAMSAAWKLTRQQAIAAIERCGAGETHQSVADDFGVARATIGMLVGGQTWRVLHQELANA